MNDKHIRILYTIPNFNTAGSGKSVYDLVSGLDRSIFEPEICCFHNKGAFFKEVEALGVKIHIFPFTSAYKPRLGFLSRVFKIRNFFKTHQFDVIHSWHWSSDISEPLAAKLAGIPYVYTKKAMGWESRYWKWRSQLSSKVIVVNEDMMSFYFSKMLHKAVQFPLAIDVNRYQPTLGSDVMREQLGLSVNDFVIISVANLVEVKGIETLLDAVNQLDNPKIKVLVVGGDSSDYAVMLKSKYKAYSHIKFIGKQLDVRPYLALSDLFVIPTKDEGRREGIPNAPLEAMAMNRIVLGSNISGIRDILKVFPDCMFQADDISDLKDKIKTIMNLSEDKRLALETQMRRRVVDEFSIEDFIERHQSLYQELVKSNLSS
ncbi:glycosyltransferase [Winogradskyella bathintestinalis]|uniref:Glycosyltransferase n=1 Tax=Winogradskyella bathintestinalis TaxID=3035208 RepID=A0ABT7ZTX1_9FLAO|nr:glycosyltransferase [Winogradskyella bathintestinalis]MDN3492416.1 glycosyltransferase [Winogradskyella bathintestinalis]